ncbi:MAG: YheT family hydrolase [bacterium]
MTETKDVLLPFHPHPLAAGGHLQTLIGYYLPTSTRLEPPTLHEVPVSDGDRLMLCENKPSRKATIKRAIVLAHGLGGDATSPYIVRLADLFVQRGWHVFRMNHRGCGQGAGLARKTYHSGRSDDISAVLASIESLCPGKPLIAVGFSLSGNALLKLLGEKKEPIASTLKGAIAVTPPIELARCAEALCQFQNRIYDLRFVRMLKQDVRRRQSDFPGFPDIPFTWKMRLRDFDEMCTAPLNNFSSAQDYYDKCSARQFLGGITLPTFLLASADDPFIPKETFHNLPENKHITYLITKSGGHMGYIPAHPTPLRTYRWMDYAILTYAERFLGRTTRVDKNETGG